jgi:hypothetical protein
LSTDWFAWLAIDSAEISNCCCVCSVKEVGAFPVLVGQHEVAGAGMQGVDHVLVERLTGRDRRGVRAERFGLGAHGGDCGVDCRFRGRDVVVLGESLLAAERMPAAITFTWDRADVR